MSCIVVLVVRLCCSKALFSISLLRIFVEQLCSDDADFAYVLMDVERTLDVECLDVASVVFAACCADR